MQTGDDGKPIINLTEEDNHNQQLSFCSTCKIIRPPRSFHCGDCGVCIEIHDHHCPWVGTCIGKRNTRYFVLFLFYTAIHAFITFILTLLYAVIKTPKHLGPLFKNLSHAKSAKESAWF